MPPRPTTCELRRIELFLAQQLSDDEQAAFESHLDACHACRRALEEQAARAETWAAARESLRAAEPEWNGRSPDAGSLASGASLVEEDDSDHLDWLQRWLAPTDDPRMLGRVGNYEIVGVIGRGGMGVVLKGFDAALNRYVAIKVLAPHLAASGSARRRFAREAKAVAAVVHENVLAIHGVDEWNELPYLVMPYIRSESLQKRIDERGPLEVKEILRIGRQAAAGLAAAHAQGLVHRDIKPANILLEDGVERLKITDFGLARAVDDASVTRTGVIPGTPQYMSPEQARGEALDARSDLFSLGSVLYAMCTGRPPFRAETSYGVLRRITDAEPRPVREINPDIPDWLAAIVARLHAKDPADRFATAAEVAELLEQCLAEVQQPGGKVLAAWESFGETSKKARLGETRPRGRVSPRRALLTMAGVLLFCLTLGVFLAMRSFFSGEGTSVNEHQHSATADHDSSSKNEARPSAEAAARDAATDWDDVAQQTDQLFRDGEAFRRRVENFWDRPASGDDDSTTLLPSPQESNP